MVLESSISLPSPLVLVIKFSNDGSYILLDIDQSTDKGGFPVVFTCSDLLSFDGSNSTECTWVSSKRIQIKPYGLVSSSSSSLLSSSLLSL